MASIHPNNFLDKNVAYTKLLRFIDDNGRLVKVIKGQVIMKEGDQCNYFFLVKNGVFRALRWVNNKEVTIGFTFEGDIDTCPYSFFTGVPCIDTIEALCDSEVIMVEKNTLFRQDSQIAEIHYSIILLLVNYIEILVQRNVEIKSYSAFLAYKNLLKNHTNDVAKIPLKYIASYLGVSNERLSRIRKELGIN